MASKKENNPRNLINGIPVFIKLMSETNIDNIVILTHTVPLDMLVLDEHNTVVNTKFKDIINNSKKNKSLDIWTHTRSYRDKV